MSDDSSVRNSGMTSDERIRNVLSRHIRKAFDKHDFTRETLHAESGVGISQIDQIMAGDVAKHRRITCEDAFNLAYALGDHTVSALTGTIHYTARRANGDAARVNEIVANALPHLSIIAAAASDGRIDHSEAPMCRDAADELIRVVTPLSSAGAA
jgi:hypothetical protein